MSDDQGTATPGRDPAIGEYIRANRGIYTREAITAALLRVGHAPADVEAAWAEVAAADAPPPVVIDPSSPPRRAVLNSWRFWLVAILTIIGLIVVPSVTSAALPDQAIGAIVGLALPVALIVAAVTLLALRRARDVAYGLLAGIAALLALLLVVALLGFILLVIVLGICIVAFRQQGFP